MNWPWKKTADDTKEARLRGVIAAIEEVTGQTPGLPPATGWPAALLGTDLGLSSVAVARLTGILRRRAGGKPLPFHKLFVKPDGSVLPDIRVSDIVDFLERHARDGES
jgi:hypothetical protein